jgi:single-stranded DNA-binding protein
MAMFSGGIERTRIYRPRLRFLKSGKATVDFAFGASRKGRDGKWEKLYQSARAYGELAERIATLENTNVALKGFLTQDSWVNDQGKKTYKDYVVVTDIGVLEEPAKEGKGDDEDVPF